MLPNPSNTELIFIFGALVSLVFTGFIVAFVVRYQQRMVAHQQERKAAEAAHERARLAAAIEAQEREQRRLASDLHDGIGADISYIKGMLKRAMMLKDEQQSTVLMNETVEALDQTVEQVRAISYSFVPQLMEEVGLQGMLALLCARINKAGEVKVVYEHGSDVPELPKEKQLLLYRILQELLQNATKHAAAQHIYVRVLYAGGDILAGVQDNGCGFDMDSPFFNPGVGIQNIQNRARLLNASFNLHSVKGKGTSAIIQLKVQDKV